jgi:AraC family transcriptional regulator of adaptative response/methylated-DNA-[protein]-cysteine methyltransferase
LTPAEQGVKATLDYIQEHVDRKITLDELSKISGLSPHHLQQTFKHMVGVSPKAFCDAQRLIRFKELIRAGESVSSACYGVGYGSSRALYEKAVQWLGMTPGTYQRHGEGTVIRYSIVQAFPGRALIAHTEGGVCSIRLGEEDRLLLRDFRDEFSRAVLLRSNSPAPACTRIVASCRSENTFLSRFSIDAQRQIFETKLWASLVLQRQNLTGRNG